jgi:hypothetical protein
MLPRWRDIATVITTRTALIEAPPPESLNALGPWASALDWGELTLGTLTNPLFDMVVFVDAWAAIERRWAYGDYSVSTYSAGAMGLYYGIRCQLTPSFCLPRR